MGFLLKEALKTICGVNQWSYAVFWRIGCQNPKVLIWEECYYCPITNSGLPQNSGFDNPDLAIDEWEACWPSVETRSSLLGIQAGDILQFLVNKMMMDNHVNIVGEGLVGRAAFTGNYQWILSQNYAREAHPLEVLNEVQQQFSAGMQTIAVVPVLPHGVVQLGSATAIMENAGFVSDVKALVLQLGFVSGALFSGNYETKETASKNGVSISLGKSASVESSGKSKVTSSSSLIADSYNQQNNFLGSRLVGQNPNILIRQIQDNLQSTGPCFQTPQSSVRSNGRGLAEVIPGMKPNVGFRNQSENGMRGAKVTPSNPDMWRNQEACFDILRSRMDQPSLGPLPTNYGSLRFLEQQMLVNEVVGNNVSECLNISNTFMLQQRTNGGLILNCCKDFGVATSHELNDLDKGVAENRFQNIASFKTEASASDFAYHLTINHLLMDNSCRNHQSADENCAQMMLDEGTKEIEADLFQATGIPFPLPDEHIDSSEHGFDCDGLKNEYGNQRMKLKYGQYEDAFVQPQSGEDLFDILGVDFKSKMLNGCWSDFLNNDRETKILSPVFLSSGQTNAPCQMKGGAIRSCSFGSGSYKEESGNYSQMNSYYGSQISSCVEQGHDMKRSTSTSTAYSKRPDETSKSNRKRLKPGENPRPRPKDRQMIQDRVKELREIVPSGAKCSIDALLERTIKHMLFLQSVTKHADKLKQTGESKIISKEGGLLLKDNFEGGATWAYEVGSQSMVCPIIVEDLNPPHQMLVEMLCEERGLFLEIADTIRGLGLTILKGVMEARSNKIWACFAIEANRDVTRMEIFISLVRLLEQMGKNNAASANCFDNDNVVTHQNFHQAASIPATGESK